MPAQAEGCAAQAELRVGELAAFSGATVGASWAAPDHFVSPIFDQAAEHAQGCRALGMRYWEARLHMDAYLSSLPEGANVGASPCPGGCRDYVKRQMGIVADLFRIGLCAPAVCLAGQVAKVVLPMALGLAIGLQQLLPAPGPGLAHAVELSHWPRLPLDFVVAGVDSCGTTSLHRNLGAHPQVNFTTLEEDSFFFRDDGVLPRLGEVEALRDVWGRGEGGGPRRQRAMCHPGLFHSARVRQALRRSPGVRAVAVVCDPIGRLEKHMVQFHLCATRVRRSGGRCWHSVAEALAADPSLLDNVRFGDHVRQLRAALGDHLYLLHQEELRQHPREAYDRIASFLGLSAFPEDFAFGRYNALGGHRTDVCRNESVLHELRERLAPEYAAMEELLRESGAEVPEVLRRRLNRCDRVQELRDGAPFCPDRSRCEVGAGAGAR